MNEAKQIIAEPCWRWGPANACQHPREAFQRRGDEQTSVDQMPQCSVCMHEIVDWPYTTLLQSDYPMHKWPGET